jgi:hypothetical protein
MSRSLDPQAQALLDRVYSMNMPLPHELSVEHVREVRPYAKVACAGDVESVGNITDLAIEGPVDDIPLRIYEPKSDGPTRRWCISMEVGGCLAASTLTMQMHELLLTS